MAILIRQSTHQSKGLSGIKNDISERLKGQMIRKI